MCCSFFLSLSSGFLFFLFKVGWDFFNMLKSLFVYGVLGVMLIPVKSQRMTVCMEEDEELRVDCLIENKPNIINTYQFSWSIGARQEIINTNVSSGPATQRSPLRNKSRVEELEPVGYRMTLSDFRDKLSDNTTFLCNISGQDANISVQKGKCTGKCACMGGSEAVGMRGRQILRGLCEPTFLLWQIIFSAAQL
uniref:Ig-like domain-containing protein n=2 Tax=Oreochromis niloticus TaxID=8128 RepID=A0A669EB83_ORENI